MRPLVALPRTGCPTAHSLHEPMAPQLPHHAPPAGSYWGQDSTSWWVYTSILPPDCAWTGCGLMSPASGRGMSCRNRMEGSRHRAGSEDAQTHALLAVSGQAPQAPLCKASAGAECAGQKARPCGSSMLQVLSSPSPECPMHLPRRQSQLSAPKPERGSGLRGRAHHTHPWRSQLG